MSHREKNPEPILIEAVIRKKGAERSKDTQHLARSGMPGAGRHTVEALARSCRTVLNLADVRLPDEYFYASLPLCVIDAVFSISVRYSSTRNTVERFCHRFGIAQFIRGQPLLPSEQLSVGAFIELYERHGLDYMTDSVFRNRQRTSTTNGILKSEAVLLFSRALRAHGVDCRQDAARIIGDEAFARQVRKIPGQRSGISLRYFYMLAGSDDYIKPDRMIARFLQAATGKCFSIEASHEVILGAWRLLSDEHPRLTLRMLDYAIWQHQRVRRTLVPDCRRRTDAPILVAKLRFRDADAEASASIRSRQEPRGPLCDAGASQRVESKRPNVRSETNMMRMQATIRGLGRCYVGGLEYLEVHIPKDAGPSLPVKEGKRVPIRLAVDGQWYAAGIRSTSRNAYIWICPDVLDSHGQGTNLAHVLGRAGFTKNDRVTLDVQGTSIKVESR